MPTRHAESADVGQYTPLHIFATGTLVPVGNIVSTTATTAITAGVNGVVTPASMKNIQSGMGLSISGGTGAAENITVKSVNFGTGTFVADFANNHSGTYNVISERGTFLGNIVVNQPGTTMTLTLYNGHPNLTPLAGSSFAVIALVAGTYFFSCAVDRGLFYTLAGSAVGDYTLMYVDEEE